jgi:hypothetical protein
MDIHNQRCAKGFKGTETFKRHRRAEQISKSIELKRENAKVNMNW